MAGETNNEAYVSTGKPKVGGAVFVGATSLTPPTDAVTALPAGFAGMGYVSEDDKSETWKLTFIEMLNVNVLKEVYGEDNVTGTLAAGIAIASGTEAHEARCWVIDMILKGNALKRTVNDTDPVGYPVTIKATSDANGKYHYEYIKAASSG